MTEMTRLLSGQLCVAHEIMWEMVGQAVIWLVLLSWLDGHGCGLGMCRTQEERSIELSMSEGDRS
jgi:hypothetical protein